MAHSKALREDEKFLSEAAPSPSKLESMSLSKRISNENRKTQFNLGTDKPVTITEASSHFKYHKIDPSSIAHSYKEAKQQDFILGSYLSHYETTASQSFDTPVNPSVTYYKHSPSKNIKFGDDKSRMESIGHSEFTEKQSQAISRNTMNSIKDNHRKCHFTLGSHRSDYNSTTRDYRAFSTTPTTSCYTEQAQNVLLGNYKTKMVTEKQDNFTPKRIPSARNRETSSTMKKTNFTLGTDLTKPIATSAESYQAKEIPRYVDFTVKEPKGNITLGNSPERWESSYQQSFYEREKLPNKISDFDKKRTNFTLGSDYQERKTLAQDSYVEKKGVNKTASASPTLKQNLVMGQYKTSFETMNTRFYGSNSGAREKTKAVEHSNAAQFSLGTDLPQYISKSQNDYGKAPEIPKNEKIVNWNRACNIVFGDSKNRWETTYAGLHFGKS